ncbi:MAG: pyridoxamine 5'-phosphate oxidase [Marmoricola sp.]
MSIPVDTTRLAEAMADHGAAYLLSTGDDGRIKAVTVEPQATADGLEVDGPGRGTAANIALNPRVTVLFWPLQPRGYTLIVDGTASGDADRLTVLATQAVLHRPAAHADPAIPPATDGACGHDCSPV